MNKWKRRRQRPHEVRSGPTLELRGDHLLGETGTRAEHGSRRVVCRWCRLRPPRDFEDAVSSSRRSTASRGSLILGARFARRSPGAPRGERWRTRGRRRHLADWLAHRHLALPFYSQRGRGRESVSDLYASGQRTGISWLRGEGGGVAHHLSVAAGAGDWSSEGCYVPATWRMGTFVFAGFRS